MSFDADSPAFAVRDALAAGLTPDQLRAASLAAPTRGARIGAAHAIEDPRAAFLAALRPLARDDQFFSHTTAARIHEMPVPSRLADDPIHLASPSLTNRVRRQGVRRLAAFRGHAWESALFPSGRAFGHAIGTLAS